MNKHAQDCATYKLWERIRRELDIWLINKFGKDFEQSVILFTIRTSERVQQSRCFRFSKADC